MRLVVRSQLDSRPAEWRDGQPRRRGTVTRETRSADLSGQQRRQPSNSAARGMPRSPSPRSRLDVVTFLVRPPLKIRRTTATWRATWRIC